MGQEAWENGFGVNAIPIESIIVVIPIVNPRLNSRDLIDGPVSLENIC